ncbi:MAG TPA: UbiH/UbiF/VisC/COQ6 family ubiquinone biosynthesis hydroxylase [Caulobacteraceae bacterium]|jgi:2-octaprenyl-6-methoxyphenol hydroxylase
MDQTLDADVIVAGAGMAGATLALALHHGGLRPILVDPQPFAAQLEPTFDGRASAIAFSSFRAWDAIGVGDGMRPDVQRIEQILVTDGHAPGASSGRPTSFFLRFDAAEIAARVHSEPLGYMVENRRTRLALAQAVEASGLTVLAPARVEGVDVQAGGARVRLAGGRELRAPVVIGAEGRGSTVRKAAGIGVVGWDYKQSGVVATLKMERTHQGVAHEYFLPAGPFAILPLTENRASLVWTESAAAGEALRAARPEVFLSLLRRRFGPFLGEVQVVGPTFVYPLSLQLAERMTAPRVALLGDAAHGVHPIAGQGLNLGLKDAAVLAEVLVDAARLGEDIGSEAVLKRYAAWRRFDTATMAAGMDAFVHLFSNDHPAIRLARGLGMAAVNRIGPARRFFMREAGGAVGDLPRLFRGEVL